MLASVGCGVEEAFMKEEVSMKAKQLYLSFFPLSATTQRTMDTHTHKCPCSVDSTEWILWWHQTLLWSAVGADCAQFPSVP